MDEEKASDEGFKAWYVVGALVLALVAAAGWAAFIWYCGASFKGHGLEGAAHFGDAFAPFVGLLTAFALVIAVVGLSLQTHELRLQRREMQDNRRALEAQQAEMARQVRAAQLASKIELQRMRQDLLIGMKDAFRDGPQAREVQSLMNLANGMGVATSGTGKHFMTFWNDIKRLEKELEEQ